MSDEPADETPLTHRTGAPELEGEQRVERLEQLVARLAKAFTAEREIAAEERDANAAAFLEVKRMLAPAKEPPSGEAATGPVPWMDRATAQQWHALAAWVDWLTEAYEFKEPLQIQPCWPAHPGIVEELAALWDSWREAAGRAPTEGTPPGDNDAMAFWHDRYLAPMLHRLQALYAFHSCRRAHESAPSAPRTDTDLLPELP